MPRVHADVQLTARSLHARVGLALRVCVFCEILGLSWCVGMQRWHQMQFAYGLRVSSLLCSRWGTSSQTWRAQACTRRRVVSATKAPDPLANVALHGRGFPYVVLSDFRSRSRAMLESAGKPAVASPGVAESGMPARGLDTICAVVASASVGARRCLFAAAPLSWRSLRAGLALT